MARSAAVLRSRPQCASRSSNALTGTGTPIELDDLFRLHKNRRKHGPRCSPINSDGRSGCWSARSSKLCRRKSAAIRRRCGRRESSARRRRSRRGGGDVERR